MVRIKKSQTNTVLLFWSSMKTRTRSSRGVDLGTPLELQCKAMHVYRTCFNPHFCILLHFSRLRSEGVVSVLGMRPLTVVDVREVPYALCP